MTVPRQLRRQQDKALRHEHWLHARQQLINSGYISVAGELHEPADTPIGWQPLAPGRATAEARQALETAYTGPFTGHLIAEAVRDATDQTRPPGAVHIERNRLQTIDLDTGQAHPGTLWANQLITYQHGQIHTRPLPNGRIWAGAGRIPWHWTDQPTIPTPIADYLHTLGHTDPEISYLTALIGRGLLGADDGGSPLPCLVGPPAGGKTTFLRFIRRIWGGQAINVRTLSDLGSRFGLTGLLNGQRLIILDDLDEDNTPEHRQGKKRANLLADGAPLDIEAKHRNPVTVQTAPSLWLAGNSPPVTIRSANDGTGRRIRILAFDQTFTPGPDPIDQISDDHISEYASAAAQLWCHWANQPPPDTIMQRTQDVIDAGRNPLDRWLDGWQLTSSGHTLVSDLVGYYQADTGQTTRGNSLSRAVRRRWPTAASRRIRHDGKQVAVLPIIRR